MKEKIGEKMIQLELLSFEQAEIILNFQKKKPKMKFGDIAIQLGFIDEDQIISHNISAEELSSK